MGIRKEGLKEEGVGGVAEGEGGKEGGQEEKGKRYPVRRVEGGGGEGGRGIRG